MNKQDIIKYLSCAKHADGVKIGDMITPHHLTTKYQIPFPAAKKILEEIAELGYLDYDEGGVDPRSKMQRLRGWHINNKGIELLCSD